VLVDGGAVAAGDHAFERRLVLEPAGGDEAHDPRARPHGAIARGRERTREGLPKAAYVLTRILPRALPEFMLRSGFGDPSKLPDSLVDRWYDLWMREGQRKAQLDRLAQYEAGDIEGLVRSIRAPVLLLWGEANTTACFEQAGEFRGLLGNAASVTFISYPGVGHMAVEEAGATIARDVRAWLDRPGGEPPVSPAAPDSA